MYGALTKPAVPWPDPSIGLLMPDDYILGLTISRALNGREDYPPTEFSGKKIVL